jgi:hypothetical protein
MPAAWVIETNVALFMCMSAVSPVAVSNATTTSLSPTYSNAAGLQG